MKFVNKFFQKPAVQPPQIVSSLEIEGQGFLSRMKSSLSQRLQKGSLESITNKVQEVQQAATNWQNFAIFFILGVFFILVSLSFLPVIILFPSKFGSLFSLGSMSILISLGIIKGSSNLLKMILNRSKILYFLAYFSTLLMTLYFSLIQQSYIFVLVFSFLQFFSLSWLFASHFPAGTTGMKFITKQMCNFGRGMLKLICRRQTTSFLPL